MPKSVLLTWVIIISLFALSLFEMGEPSTRTAPLTPAFSGNAASATETPNPNAAPSRNFYRTHTPTLTWTAVSWAASYEIQISISPNFSALVTVPNPLPSDKLYYTTDPLPDGEYYWRVRALNANSKPGSWSVLEHFTISAVIPTTTYTPSATPTGTVLSVPTTTYTPSATLTGTVISVPSVTYTPSFTPTSTLSRTPTVTSTLSRTPTVTSTLSRTPTPTSTFSPAPPSITPTATSSTTATPTFSRTPVPGTPTFTFTPSVPTVTPTATGTFTAMPPPVPPPTLPGGGCVDHCD